jgi:class 3 adenylate cyclase/streptogramin lyase
VTELLTGTVAFLFTDIEGSTKLLHDLDDDYAVLLHDHQALLGEEIQAHGGRVVDTQGDSFFAVFPRVKDAAAAAADAQRRLSEHQWPQGVQIKVRMGIHAAEPELEHGRYVGLGVHRAARVGSAAHGGQVLLSNAAAGMLGDSKLELRDLGAHPLKDFDRPEHLYQLQVGGLPAKFPPPRTGVRKRRRRLLLALAALPIAAAAIAVPLALTGGLSSVKVGPASLGVIDPKTNKVVDAIDSGMKAPLIAAGEGAVWLADPQNSTLAKIDPKTRNIVDRRGVPGTDVFPTALAAGAGSVWITSAAPGPRSAGVVLVEIDPGTTGLRRSLLLAKKAATPSGATYTSAYLATDCCSVWVLDTDLGRVERLNPAAYKPRVIVKQGVGGYAIAHGEGATWVAGENSVTRIDPRTGGTATTAPLGEPTPEPDLTRANVSVAAGAGSVWFASVDGSSVWKIDPASGASAGTIEVGRGPSAIAVGEGAVWVAAKDGTVTRIDPRSSKVVATVDVGHPLGGIVAAYGKVWVTPLT